MEYAVLITNQPGNGYTARPLLFPDVVVAGDTENDVLEQVRRAIVDLRRRSRVVQVEVPASPAEDQDPWLRVAGLWAADPDWAQFQDEIATYRQSMDERIFPAR